MKYLSLFLIDLALTTYCIVDVLQRPEDSPHGLRKILWIILLLVFTIAPGLVWLYLKYQERGHISPQRRPLSPDDDPEYLAWLKEQERRRRQGRES
jgi:hypothetical protein